MGEALQPPLKDVTVRLSGSDLLGPISASPQVRYWNAKLYRRHIFCCNELFKLVQYVAEALVDFASLTRQDTLFDLGCNDGRGVESGAAGALRCSRSSAVLRQGRHNSCQADCCKRSWYRGGCQSSCKGTAGCSKWQACHDVCCC